MLQKGRGRRIEPEDDLTSRSIRRVNLNFNVWPATISFFDIAASLAWVPRTNSVSRT